MKKKTITLYEYTELSPEAKTKALGNWNRTNDDPFMQSHMINLLKEKLGERGIKYDADSIDVLYSLSHCQGDGFMFTGKLQCRGKTLTITHNDPHYCHSNTASFSYDGKFTEKQLKLARGVYEAICKEMEEAGYAEIEYQQSEEVFMETCEANGYTFREDGTMENF